MEAFLILRKSKLHLEHIRLTEIHAYVILFDIVDIEFFIEMLYGIDDIVVKYEITKHNEKLDRLRSQK